MSRRLPRILVAALAALAVGASPAPAALDSPSVRLAACEPAAGEGGGTASFVGRMRRVSGAARMSIRFTLLERLGGGGFARVDAPGLRTWRKSRPGAPSFRYAQTVAALMTGGSYRAQVDFRWLSEKGAVLRSARRRSAVCHQPGGAPNLTIAGIEAVAGSTADAPLYAIEVANDGGAVATRVGVLLAVDEKVVDMLEIPKLGPGERRRLIYAGPPCRSGLRAVADPQQTVRESAEDDNVRTAPCAPAPAY